jgi:hypothetical protein
MHKDCLSVNSFMRRSLILIFCRRNAPTCSVVISYSFITSSLPFTIILYVVVFLQCTFNLFRSKKVEQRSKLVILSFSLSRSLSYMHARTCQHHMYVLWMSLDRIYRNIFPLVDYYYNSATNCQLLDVYGHTYLSPRARVIDWFEEASKQEKRVR